MGIFDLFKKKEKGPAAVGSSNDELKNELLDAIKRNHLTEFEMLCRQNEARIVKSFPQWRKTPEEFRNNPEAAQLYVNCLMIMANYFSRELNRDELRQVLSGVDNSELTQQWQEALAKTRKMMEELNVQEAIPILEEYANKASENSGMAVATLLPLTLGHLGECYFQVGEPEKAVEPTRRAMELVNQQGDLDATVAYLRNLYEIHRYLGDGKTAAGFAKKIAEKLYDDGKLVLASNWKHQSRAVEAGEPLLRVVLKIGDELFELDEIPVVKSEKVEFITMRNRFELRTATALCEKGKKLAEEGKLDAALAAFEGSALLDKFAPVPHYFMAAIKMHQMNLPEAVQAYERTEALAPGFESCRSELWLARKIAAGEIDYDVYRAVVQLHSDAPVEQRMIVAEQLEQKHPQFAEGLYHRGKLLASSGRVAEAVAVWKRALEVAEEPDVKTRLCGDLSMTMNTRAEKLEYVRKGRDILNGNLIATAMCSYVVVQLESEEDDDEDDDDDNEGEGDTK